MTVNLAPAPESVFVTAHLMSEHEAQAVEYFTPVSTEADDLFEKMYWASITQGDGPLDGYSGRTPFNHQSQMGLMYEWCQMAGWEEEVLHSALQRFHENWKERTGHWDGEPHQPIVR
jgi:hypothetical protein